MPICAVIFLGYVIFDRYFWGARFQNKTFCNVILMYSLIKCSIFAIYASNLLESIKIYKLTIWLPIFVNIIGCNV